MPKTGAKSLKELNSKQLFLFLTFLKNLKLNRSGSNIRELYLSLSNITGVEVEEGLNSLPNLETLNLFNCKNLTVVHKR